MDLPQREWTLFVGCCHIRTEEKIEIYWPYQTTDLTSANQMSKKRANV
jgi:hypothetical protein